ncbi:PQQ-dependent sugar dehydrogenase [Chenggangzhangella methanolivorans]|uniref:PQQ-dependent sugar dehydrogenase n=1 Tax=Chenggangzhangella methanolivorans TaxID=1437009 RepID=A0A9E6UPN2_9HYPH|nr:PQQ-dependent sugar dehydrogenase [Chenggangzhangella methanolivorans]QZN99944.1 PQQ-dependent sugar dehydrogenase [Chenggangzhangella methanolivorans]
MTELGGRLMALETDGSRTAIRIGSLPDVYFTKKTGLMDVAADPEFSSNGLIYLTFAYGRREANNTRLVRARLDGDALRDMRVLFSATPKAGNSHYGGRIAFLPDGTLLLTLGDGFDRREDAQDLSNHLGKLVRLDREGRAPADNPFVARAGAAPEVFSLGHRNVQGVVVDPADGSILISEHGPRGGRRDQTACRRARTTAGRSSPADSTTPSRASRRFGTCRL